MMLEAHLTCTNVQSQYQQALDNLFQTGGENSLKHCIVKSCAMETQTHKHRQTSFPVARNQLVESSPIF